MAHTLDTILKLEVPLIVRVGQKTMQLNDVMSLVPGTIIELAKSADEELDLLVNNISVGQGAVVKVGENFGLSISFIGDIRSRIAALGGAPQIASMPEPDGDLSDDEAAALAEQFLNG